jgi:hypothetical protein
MTGIIFFKRKICSICSMKYKNALLILSLFIHTILLGQDFPFEVKLDSITIPGLGGLQSFSVGQHNGKWLVIGGRLDGLHRRQPWASFDSTGHNNRIMVIDPIKKEVWKAPLDNLPVTLREQLSSTNMEFLQRGDLLYLAGGYGYSPTLKDHITHPFLTIIDIPSVIDAVLNDKDPSVGFNQIKDERMAVTGGQLVSVNGIFFMVGGHRFDGKYNPMNNPTFVQTYTSAIRKFTVEEEGTGYKLVFHGEITDEKHLRRRDFNVLPQILPNGEQGLIAFSGVFQKDRDLPYLNAVEIDADSFHVIPSFAQYYNHYHCANLSLYSSKDHRMHNLFFGGIAHYYDSAGYLVQDNDVPFVKTIARVTRAANGWLQEYKLPNEMPGYFGAASEFIPAAGLPAYDNEAVKLDDLKEDTVLLGYVYGGIRSSAANIFWVNTGVESIASPVIYPVYLIKNPFSGITLNEQSINALQLQIYPNPLEGEVTIAFTMPADGDATVVIKDLMGVSIHEKTLKKIKKGECLKDIRFRDLKRGDIYYLHLTVNGKTVSQKMIVN